MAETQYTTQSAVQTPDPTQEIKVEAFNPTVFDPGTYLTNKAAQLNATKYQGKSNWTAEDAANAIKSAGFTLEDHYKQYGMAEGVSPYKVPTVTPPTPEPPAPLITPQIAPVTGTSQTPGTTPSGNSITKPEEIKSLDLGSLGTPYREDPAKWTGMISKLSAPTFGAREITADETVAGQMQKILSENSPYMQSAKAEGIADANARGLLSSSLASGMSQKAAIDAAAPIAAQDASTHAASALSAQNATQQAEIMKFDGQVQTIAKAQQAYYDSMMELEKFKYTEYLDNKKFWYDSYLQDTKYADEGALKDKAALYESALQKQKTDAEATLQKALKQIDANIELEKIAANDRANFVQAMGPVMQQYQTTFQTIQAQPNEVMDQAAKTWALNTAALMYKDQMTALASIYGYPVSWPYEDSAAPYGEPKKNNSGDEGSPPTGGEALQQLLKDLF